ncbi:hypothetical protein CC80DRAFT_552553 [Byssothecium circinans]|uniref:Protein SMG7 n=1 Tax=Byssothecium circinans TaxID=147558 RepID=A0A6A5THP0_9PLEO|nr:hypothetical protein CC80DRAFT_552553 [Byssothecium circinans]
MPRRACSIEDELNKLADSNASGQELAALLQEYRAACENAIFADFEYASTHHIETQLWTAHLKVNTALRKENKLYKKNKDRVVELRKLQKAYMQFIKASQRFYRQYILNMDAQFEGIPELRRVALRWKDDASRTSSPQRIPASLKKYVLKSCHNTLIQLGDLSRYRETEIGDEKERNWGPAIGYYSLAAEIYPDSGHPHNQMAVVAREEGNHFRAVYHIYRSLASNPPFPQAKGNLELEFKRILNAWEKGELINNHKSADGNNAGRALIAWFVRLHSKCYKGQDFKEHEELEGEVLSHLAIELKEHSMDSMLQKIILINLAAEYFATMQMQSATPPANIFKTYFYFLRLNVKTFFTLLQVMQPELERLSEGHDVTQNDDDEPRLSDKVTAVARRVLPGLRLYSTWFARFWNVLDANIADTLTRVEVQELWRSYAETLTLLASSFPVPQLPEDNYMLDEDIETIGFQPLISPETLKLWYNNEELKPKGTELERNHPNVEMLMRVRDLLVDGLLLTQNPEAPLDLDGSRFIYREAGLPSVASPNNGDLGSPSLTTEPMNFPLFPTDVPVAEDQKTCSVAAPPSESASTTIARDSAMNRMVDDLVGVDDVLDPLQEEDENLPPTPPEQTFEDTTMVSSTAFGPASFCITDLVTSVQNYKKPSGSPSLATPVFSTPMNRVGSTNSVLGPAHLPSLPDGYTNSASIWNRSTPTPASPMMANNLDMRSSPLSNMHQNGHVRGDSYNSNHSYDNSVASTARPVRPLSGGLGNGAAWGNSASPSPWSSIYDNGTGNGYSTGYANNNGANNYNHPFNAAADLNLMGSMAWNSQYADYRSSYGHTPPGGQGG